MSKHTVYVPRELEEAMEPYRDQMNLSEIMQIGIRQELKHLIRLESLKSNT